MTPQKTFPDSTTRSRFDLGQMAENGLKRGYTTGSCATAAVKAALLKLVCNESPTEVDVTLPDGAQYLTVPIDGIRDDDDGAVRADVIKDAGDDPDQTHRARIFARVKRNRVWRNRISARRGSRHRDGTRHANRHRVAGDQSRSATHDDPRRARSPE